LSGYENCSLLIDLKPNRKDGRVSLYEVLDVWGHSEHSWTPLLLHLELIVDGVDPTEISRERFQVSESDRDGPIYEWLYADGSVNAGQLVGTWSPPRPSSANSPVLWPHVLRYFCASIQGRSPGILSADRTGRHNKPLQTDERRATGSA